MPARKRAVRQVAALALEDIPDVLTLREAAALLRLSVDTVRRDIRSGALRAFIPRGADSGHTGPALGYRIHKADLQAWYFGDSK